MGPVCRGATRKSRPKQAQFGVRSGRGGGMMMGGGPPSLLVGDNTRPLWRVYDMPNGEIEQVISLHKERFGKVGMVLLPLDVPGEVYLRAKRLVAIVIKHRKVMTGQVWVI
jgi:hypothetical protein